MLSYRTAAVTTALLFSAASLHGAAVPSTQANPAAAAWSTYQNFWCHFSVDIPTLQRTSFASAIFRSEEENGTSSSVIVGIQMQKRTRDEYLDSGVKLLVHEGSIINSTTKLQVSGCDAGLIDYTQLPKNGHHLRFLVLAVIGPDRVYLITCTSTVENFPTHEMEFHDCVKSFALGDAPGAIAATTKPSIRRSTYINHIYKFSLIPPPFRMAAHSMIPALFRSTEKDGSETSIAIVTDALKTTREKAINNVEAMLSLSNGTMHSQKNIQVSGFDAAVLDWEQIAENGVHHRFLALKVFTRDRIYTILCTGAIQNFAKHEAEFHQCFDSFKLDIK